MATLPFTDLLLLDLTQHRGGPVAARFFADWGAQVIKVEPPWDNSDSMGGKREDFDYQNLHRNKRSLSLNLKTAEGKAIFRKLALRADIVLENFRPGVKYRLGVDYESLRQANPRIICGSISGFGQTGPYAERPAVDQIIQGMSGLMSVTGYAGQGPLRAGASVADISAGMVLVQGILTALYQRERTGQGQWVHTSLLESLVSVLDFQVARWLRTGEIPGRVGNDHPNAVPTGLFLTADGQVNLAAPENAKFAALCEALQLSHLLEEPDYATLEGRWNHREKLYAIIGDKTRAIPTQELIERLNAVGVPCGPVYSIPEAIQDTQMKSLEMAVRVDHPRLGQFDVLGQPLSLGSSSGRPPARRAAPDLGEHTDEILSSLLGYEKTALDSLRSRGVI